MRHTDELKQVVEDEDIVVGVLAVPTAAAQGLADQLVDAGVKIIFNYSEALLQVPAGGDGPHVQPRGRPALRAVLLPHVARRRMIDLRRRARDLRGLRRPDRRHRGGVRARSTPTRSSWCRASRSCATPPPTTRCWPIAIAGELISSEIEIRSGAGSDLEDARARQPEARRRLFALAREHGIVLGATGTHPLSDYRDQHIIDTEHYRRVEDGLKYVALAQQHVLGARPRRRARRRPGGPRLRPAAADPAAAAGGRANSPFIDGRDSGLHSARSQTFTKSFPRCGIPDAFGSWRAWADYVELLVRTTSIVEFTQLWWSVRPHHAFGTVEVRICDAQMTAEEADGLTALITACVRARRPRSTRGRRPPTCPAG